jgi:NAD(P)-dependent dehydrogenase (short-subunit alcohol dehydrogenase family)
MTQRVLVIGGTGMLAGAVRHIARRGASVTLIARAPQALAREVGAHALPMD